MPYKNPQTQKEYFQRYDAVRRKTRRRKQQIRQAIHRWYKRHRSAILSRKRQEYQKHRNKQLRRSKKYYQENPARRIRSVLNSLYKRKFRMSLQGKKEMYIKQKGLCAACCEPLLKNFRRAHIDHIHGTAIVRGLIHWYCNFVVGHEDAHPGVISKVLKYKRKWDRKVNS